MASVWHLRGTTPSQWARGLVPHADELLLEQAHLEKKAAAAAMAFLFRYPRHASLQRSLSRLAREELVHFERVVELMERRGQVFGPQVPGPYAEHLKQVVRFSEPDRLLDELLVCGVIEARSCERMGLLAAAFDREAPELSSLYRDLVTAEERHRGIYLDLALGLFAEPEVKTRWDEITAHEASVLRSIPRSPRLHSA